MDLKGLRRDVNRKLEELQRDHPSGYIYLTSLDNRERNISAGTTTEVTLPLAAQHLCLRTHEISTPEQVAEYHRVSEERRAQIISASKRHVDKELRISVDR